MLSTLILQVIGIYYAADTKAVDVIWPEPKLQASTLNLARRYVSMRAGCTRSTPISFLTLSSHHNIHCHVMSYREYPIDPRFLSRNSRNGKAGRKS